jgi:hypothetical protein
MNCLRHRIDGHPRDCRCRARGASLACLLQSPLAIHVRKDRPVGPRRTIIQRVRCTVDALARARELTQSLDPDRVPDLRLKLHVLHPPALCRRRHRASSCRIFTPAQPTESAASTRDFCSGAYTTAVFRYTSSRTPAAEARFGFTALGPEGSSSGRSTFMIDFPVQFACTRTDPRTGR